MKIMSLIALWLFAAVAMASDDGVAGKWLVKTDGPHGRTMEATFQQNNNKITVQAVDAMGSREGAGYIEGNNITWFVKVKMPGSNRKITFTGKVDGDSMHGTSTFTGTSKVKWSGKRISSK
ncbi:MAG: hypothetical protein KZQ91_03270 [Candidatus Thiodiazotropha sp. (ex Lucinoma borealis)]|nr:hypothetical protein [Candidatus Thiodiazotropha sp. (ex Lucinoma borealis)]